jgi:hypothetical protein
VLTPSQGNGKFLNDLWKFYFQGSGDGCNWQLLIRSQTLKEQFLSRDSYPMTPNRCGKLNPTPFYGSLMDNAIRTIIRSSAPFSAANRRGLVPGRPAARFGHVALLVNVTLENLQV